MDGQCNCNSCDPFSLLVKRLDNKADLPEIVTESIDFCHECLKGNKMTLKCYINSSNQEEIKINDHSSVKVPTGCSFLIPDDMVCKITPVLRPEFEGFISLGIISINRYCKNEINFEIVNNSEECFVIPPKGLRASVTIDSENQIITTIIEETPECYGIINKKICNKVTKEKIFDLSDYDVHNSTLVALTSRKFFIIGGSSDLNGIYPRKNSILRCFEFRSQNIEEKSQMDSKRMNASCLLSKNKSAIFVVGGKTGINTLSNTSEYYLIEKDSWVDLPNLRCPKYDVTLVHF